MNKDSLQVQGYLAEFSSPAELITAAARVAETGFKNFDCHSPFPVHGLDKAMGEKRSRIGLFVAIAALIGFSCALYMQYWMSAVDYKIVIAGKPFFSYQAFFPVVFSVTVLLSAVTALVAMLSMIRLRFHHPVFFSDRFSSRASDDGFFISILADDPQFNVEKTGIFLESIGGKNVEALEED